MDNSGASRGRLGWAVAAGALLVATGTVLAPATPASAGSVITVTTTEQKIGGPGGCSLQEAILSANHDSSSFRAPANDSVVINSACASGSGADVIVLSPSVYVMTRLMADAGNHLGLTATPMITSEIVIEGRGARLERERFATNIRAFSVGPTGHLDLREVHVSGFSARGGHGGSGGGGGVGAGGAIYVHDGTLRVQWSTFERNGATGGNGSTGNQFHRVGGGGGGLGGNGEALHDEVGHGGGGGGSGGNGASGGGGGTAANGDILGGGGFRCGGDVGENELLPSAGDGEEGQCPGGGGGGGESQDRSPGGAVLTTPGDGGEGAYGGGGGGGGGDSGDGGDGGFGGGGGAGPAFFGPTGGSGGDGGFGGGGGAGPGGDVFGEPGDGGTFAGNATDTGGGGGAGLGGAIFGHSATVEISNSTFSGNYVVRGVGGGDGAQNGADAGGAIFTVGGSLVVRSSTVAGNESTGDGAGVVVYAPTTGEATSLTMSNTIVAGNVGRDQCFVTPGVVPSGSSNLVVPHLDDSRSPCPAITQTGDPLLGPLALNSPGRTPTMALAAASPAVDTGDPAVAPLDDQRGVPRPQFNGVDIGAYELGLDTTAPVAAPTVSPAANGEGWNSTAVVVSWNWSDDVGGSGIDSANCTSSSTTSTEGLGLALTATCADVAGNVGTASFTVNVDLTAPTVTCAAVPMFIVGSSATGAVVSATLTDGLSGPVAASLSATLTAADLASAGVRSVQLTGADRAGHQTTVACRYAVSYDVLGFLEPIPQASYRRGSTIPVRFKLGSASGAPISDAVAAALLRPVCLVQVTLDGVSQGCARYDAASDTFQVDVKVSKTIALGQHTIGVALTAAGGSGVVYREGTTVVIR